MEWLRRNHPRELTGAEIIKHTGLERSSVYKILNRLYSEKIIDFVLKMCDGGGSTTSYDRPVRFYSLVEDKVGEPNFKFRILNDAGTKRGDYDYFFKGEELLRRVIPLLEEVEKFQKGCELRESFDEYPRKEEIKKLMKVINNGFKTRRRSKD